MSVKTERLLELIAGQNLSMIIILTAISRKSANKEEQKLFVQMIEQSTALLEQVLNENP